MLPHQGENPTFDMSTIVIGVPAIVTATVGLIVAGLMVYRISLYSDQLEEKNDPERKKMNSQIRKLGTAISVGATTFLHKEYFYLYSCALALFVLVSAAINWRTGLCYLAGCFTSSICGYIGMKIATYSNTRTAVAAEKGLNDALTVSFASGSVMYHCRICWSILVVCTIDGIQRQRY